MGQVRIKKLTVQGFRAFQERQSTNVLPDNGLVGIRGFVKETGGSSGAGKSSIAYAIAYAFGFLPFSATSQQNWFTDTPMQVELELDTDQGPAILKRGKEFSLTINGKTTQGAAKSVEEAIRKMNGVPTDLMKSLTFHQQKKPSRFLSMTDSEKKEFLSLLLGADEIEQQISEATKRGNKLQEEANTLKQVIEALSKNLTPPAEPKYENTEQLHVQLLEATSACEAARKHFEDNKPVFEPPQLKIDELNVQLASCTERVNALIQKGQEERKAMNEELNALNAQITQLSLHVSQQSRWENRQKEIQGQADELDNEKCPTCHQEWSGSVDFLEILRLEFNSITAKLQGIETLKGELKKLQEDRSALSLKMANYKTANLTEMQTIQADLRGRIAVEKTKLQAAQNEYNALLYKMERELREKEADFMHLEERILLIETRNDAMRKMYETQVRAHMDNIKVVQDKTIELAAKQLAANEELDFALVLKSYLGSLFDEVLAQISSETNDLLRNVPNTASTTVTFTSETVTAKGTSKQEIRPVIMKNGNKADMESGVSGGQLESIALAVDLSIAKVIGQRTGVKPGFMIFDESFSAHCLPVKEACIQVLQKASNDCLILVVDHATELKEYFSTFIDIESEREISRIVNKP